MASPAMSTLPQRKRAVTRETVPLLYEDEVTDMGEENLHMRSIDILLLGVDTHLEENHATLQAFSNLNMYYPQAGEPAKRTPCVAADVMIVEPFQRLPERLTSYTVGREAPAPRLTLEVLSEGTAEEKDLGTKPDVYAFLGVAEYILVDPTGEHLPQRLLLRQLQPDGTWKDLQDADGGVTSLLGFRIVIEADGKVRVLDARTGRKYLRPREGEVEALARRRAEALVEAEREAHQLEAEARQREVEARQREVEARQRAEKRIQELEAEVERLRKQDGQ